MVDHINIGIIGFGWVARDYMLPAIHHHDRARLAAVCSARSEEMANLPPDVACFTELEVMLREADVDAVYIATPNHLHRAQTVACLAAGWHVLCEKPMATTVADAEAMVAAARRSGCVYATAFDQRFHPAHRAMRELIRTQQLGTITQVRIDYACWLPADWATDNWRVEQDKAGGGAVIDLAPHGLDLLEFLLDDTITEMQLYLQTAAHSYAVDDGGVMMLRFARGTLGTLHVGYNRPDAFPRRRLEVIGTDRMLIAKNTMGQDAGGTVRSVDADGTEQPMAFDQHVSPFAQQLRHFVAAIASEGTALRTPDDDLRLFKLLNDALHRAQNSVPTPAHSH